MVLIVFLCLSGSDPQSSNQMVCYYETTFKSLEETKQACAACEPVGLWPHVPMGLFSISSVAMPGLLLFG